MSSNIFCGCKGPSSSKRCACGEDFNDPPRKHVPVNENADDENGDVPVNEVCNIDKVNMEGRTALHKAAKKGDVLQVMQLLAEGSNPLLRDVYGYTPLLVALYEPQETVAEVLIDLDCGIDVADKKGCTPLHVAIDYSLETVILQLLLKNVNLNVQDDNGEYPLQSALKLRSLNAAKIILKIYALKNIEIDFEEMQIWFYEKEHCVSVLSECIEEIKCMKETKIEGTNLTFYKVAMGHLEKVPRYLTNENVSKIQNAPMDTFQNYSDIISLNLKKAMVRKELCEKFLEYFTLLPGKWSFLPETYIDNISSYLNENHLRNFIYAVKND